MTVYEAGGFNQRSFEIPTILVFDLFKVSMETF